MADAGETEPDPAFRLEAALDRIALARRGEDGPDRVLARRLDTLIADLRAVLGRDSPG